MIGRLVLCASILAGCGAAGAADPVLDKAVEGILKLGAEARSGDPEVTLPLSELIPPQPSREVAGTTLFRMFTPEMVEATRVAAEEGDARSQYRMGAYYESGTPPLAKDALQALEWYRKSAGQGFAAAQFRVGQALLIPDLGLQKDAAAAAAQIRPAAERDYPPAQRTLADMLQNGLGVPRDEAQAAVWYRKAADAGVRVAMTKLGWKLLLGGGVAKDEKQGIDWFRKAAERNFKYARVMLCAFELSGTHMPRNPAMAFQSCSAVPEEALAQKLLAYMYLNGQGTGRDPGRAVEWYRKAALQGDGEALSRLGDLYGSGTGVRRSAVTAHLLKEMAVRQGFVNATADRERISVLVTDADRERAARLAGEWRRGQPLPGGAGSP